MNALLALIAALFGRKPPAATGGKLIDAPAPVPGCDRRSAPAANGLPPAATGGQRLWMPLVEKELGLKETPGPRSTPRIVELRQIAGCPLDGDDGDVPWCKIFVNAIFVMASLPIAKDWRARSIERDPNFVRLDGPAYGCLVSFWRGSRGGGRGHIAFYLGETPSKVRVIGGNQNDSVSRAFYLKNGRSGGIVGYSWPRAVPPPKVAPIYLSDDGEPVASAV